MRKLGMLYGYVNPFLAASCSSSLLVNLGSVFQLVIAGSNLLLTK